MRLFVSANGGNGGKGGWAGPPIDIYCEPPEECSETGPTGGKGGDGGDGGSLNTCATHPILFSAGGGRGGNGGNSSGGYYEHSNGGDGGEKGEGCSSLSEATGGAGGDGGYGYPGAPTCSEGSDGADGTDLNDPISINFATPIDAGGLFFTEVLQGYDLYELDEPYYGSWAEGDHFNDPWNADPCELELYLVDGASEQQIYIEDVDHELCYDQIKFWINKNESGVNIGFPDPGIYDLKIKNACCEDILEDAITIIECSAGKSCTCPYPTDCDTVLDKTDFPGSTSNMVSCLSGPSITGHWIQVDVPDNYEITVDMDNLSGSQGGLAIFEDCGDYPLYALDQDCGYGPNISYENDSGQEQSFYILTNYHQCENPLITVSCE